MYRPVLMPYSCHSPRWRWRQTWGRLIALLTIWICASVSLRYGYYGDRRMVLGPSSSRLIRASSLFVEQVEARDDERKGVLIYGFSEKPELSQETNWSMSNYLIVGSYNRKEFSLWLNKGSKIRMRWETQTSRLDQLRVIVIKGEQKHDEALLPHLTSSFDAPALSEPLSGKDTEYTIEEDNKYYTGSCQLNLLFPNTQFLVLTTPDNVDVGGWYIELSFVARVITYIAILGFFIAVIFLLLKYLGACDAGESAVDTAPMEIQYDYDRTTATETTPILTEKHLRATYGTGKEREDDDETGSSSSSSEDLYDAKLCVICYDDQRNCFFVPCGHCATCYNCAQRILSEDNKMCPICRRLIHKVRRLFSP
ncbi:hypothetical protein SLA2020_143380 [Shorea laevis]